MIINTIYENQNLLSLSFLVELRDYQHPCKHSKNMAAGCTGANLGLGRLGSYLGR